MYKGSGKGAHEPPSEWGDPQVETALRNKKMKDYRVKRPKPQNLPSAEKSRTFLKLCGYTDKEIEMKLKE